MHEKAQTWSETLTHTRHDAKRRGNGSKIKNANPISANIETFRSNIYSF